MIIFSVNCNLVLFLEARAENYKHYDHQIKKRIKRKNWVGSGKFSEYGNILDGPLFFFFLVLEVLRVPHLAGFERFK